MAGPHTIPTAVPGAGDPPAEFNTMRGAVLDLDAIQYANPLAVDPVAIFAAVGQYQPSFNFVATISTGAIATGATNALPFSPAGNFTADQIGMEVSTAGAGGALIRMGLYASNAAGDRPGSLITDYGTIASDTTGYKMITINQAFEAGNTYWLAWAAEVAASTVRQRNFTIKYPDTQARVFDGYSSSSYVFRMNATGALPSTWTDNGWVSVTVPVIAFRRSA